jgi:hypothetical protein
MSKLFSVSFACEDRVLHEVMIKLEGMPIRHVMARPIPMDQPAPETAPRLEVTHVKRSPDGGKGKARVQRSDAAFLALGEASKRFLEEREGQFTAKDFEAFLTPFAQGRPFLAGSRLAYYAEQGKVRRVAFGLYEVVRAEKLEQAS